MSAAVLRELVAKLGFQVDDAGFKKAADGIAKVKASVGEADAKLRNARGQFVGSGAAAAQAAGRYRDAAGRLREANGRFVSTGESAAKAGGGVGRFFGLFGRAKKASGDVGGLGASVGKLQSGLLQLGVGIGIGAVIKQVVTLASDANETDNVMGEVFGQKGAQEIKDWAETTSKWMGRSKFTLRENAAALGAMIEPMTGSAVKAQEMSKQLAGLAIDLGSFFNSSDEDALAALKSGISGELEPLRRFGIVMTDAALQEYAHTQGIHKKIAAMNIAEKTELRYQFILAHTTKAQGDAHRTIDGFANASRALKDNLKDLGTSMGQKLLPAAGKLIVWGNNAISLFLDVSRKSSIVEASLATLAVGFAVLKAEAAAALIVPLAGFALLALAADDLYTLFTGGQSAIGDWLDELGGIGTADALVTGLKDSMKALGEAIDELPDMQGMWDVWTGAVDDFGFAIDGVMGRIEEFFEMISPENLAASGLEKLASLFGYKAQQKDLTDLDRTAGRGMSSDKLDSLSDIAQQRKDQRNDRIRGETERRRGDRKYRAQAAGMYRADAPGSGDLPGFVDRHDESYGVLAPRDEGPPPVRFGRARVSAPPTAAPAAAAASSTTTVNNGPIHVTVAAGAGAADVVRAARVAANAERRRTADALKRGG